MRDADHRRLTLLGELPRVAGQALVGVEVERVALDGVRDQRRLVRVVPPPAYVVRDLPLHRRGWRLSRERRGSCEPRRIQAGTADLLGGQGADEEERDRRDRGEEERPSHRRPPGAGWPGAFVATDAGTTLTALFLKSVCFEIG